jgi:16S rRNA (cytosine967-C5)-methyltransferase
MDIPGLPARRAALRLLDAVLRRGETLDQAAHNALQNLHGDSDRALSRAIAAETLRWLADLDALIDSATRQPLPEDAKPRAVLRMMLAQWLRLDTPPHAVIATALPLLAGGPRRLAHGVFSTLVKRGATLPMAPSLPPAVATRWGERGAGVGAALAQPPALDLSLRDPRETADWAERLGAVTLLSGHLRLPRGDAVESLAGFAEGAWWVQDIAASLPARLLGPGQGEAGERLRVLDLCAAPGGKTLQLAAAGWDVTALDISARRIERLRQNLARTGLAADVVTADALEWEPAEPFDAVLLDAPCTATGTCRRHPDVLHRIGPRQIAEMAELQARLLARAASWVRPGGRLVYAVCSLEREEGEEQAAQVRLAPQPIVLDGFAATGEGWLRTAPGSIEGGMDGFFIAQWRA